MRAARATTRASGNCFKMQDAVEPQRASALLARYEVAWGAISERNGALCTRAGELAGSVRTAADRCSVANSGFQQLQAELLLLSSCTAALHEITAQAAAAGAHLEALEEQLSQLTIAQVQQAEVEWRQQEMERADKAQRQRRQELQELRLRMARQSVCRLEREQEERRRVFNEQFEQEREEFIQRGGAVADERRPTKAPEPSVSLSDAQPAPEPTDEKLDDFFAK